MARHKQQPDGWARAKARIDVIVPAITTLGLCIAGLYALVQYSDHKAEKRIEATLAYVQRFASDPVHTHRVKIAAALAKHQDRLLGVIASKELPQGEINKAYRKLVLDIVQEEALVGPIREVMLYFEQLAHCVNLGLCEASAVSSMLSIEGRTFFRQFYPYFCHLRAEWRDPSIGQELQRFFNPGSVDKACRDQ